MTQKKLSFNVFLFGISLAMLITNIFLIYQNMSLSSQLEATKPKVIKENFKLEEFLAKDLSDNQTKITYASGEKKRILLFFRTSCSFCHKQMAFWKQFTNDVENKYQITAITTDTNNDEINAYLKKYNVENWEVLKISQEQAENAYLLGTPITILADKDGLVEKVWIGFWHNKTLSSVNEFFSIAL